MNVSGWPAASLALEEGHARPSFSFPGVAMRMLLATSGDDVIRTLEITMADSTHAYNPPPPHLPSGMVLRRQMDP